jgi:hypothetical protein
VCNAVVGQVSTLAGIQPVIPQITEHPRSTQMATAAQVAANRANARKSTGPRTLDGKQRCSMNALKHGLSARTVVLNHEDESGYHEVRGSLHRQYQPATPQECMLVDQLASSWWRTIRARQYETDMMNMQVDTLKRRHKNRKTVHTNESDRQALAVALTVEPHDDFKTFFRYEAAIERSFYRALNQLERMQKERRKAEESTEIGSVSQNATMAAEPVEPESPRLTIAAQNSVCAPAGSGASSNPHWPSSGIASLPETHVNGSGAGSIPDYAAQLCETIAATDPDMYTS